jgi:hypothetical protein
MTTSTQPNRDAAFHVGRCFTLSMLTHPSGAILPQYLPSVHPNLGSTLRIPTHPNTINHGRHRTTHNATPGASSHHSDHARTSTPHGRSPPTSQSPPHPTAAKPTIIAPLNPLPKCPNTAPNRRPKATSAHRRPFNNPRRPWRLQQQQ